MSSDPRNEKKFYLDKTVVSRIWFFFFGIYVLLFMKLTVTGLENLPSGEGFVLSSNHLEQVDSFLLIYAMQRPVFFMAKEEIFVHPASDFVVRRLGAFPVHRDKLDRWTIKYALKVLQNGRPLGIYPEGGRSETNSLQEGKVGPAYLAIKGDSPIVPVAIVGTHRLFERFPRRTPVTVQVGQPLCQLPDETPQQLTERLMRAIAAMLPSEMRGVYG
jgi:1-acyl-sn-glycerol-3-phosphate acyltransferase